MIREYLNEEFWKKLAAEEAMWRRLHPHQGVQSSRQKGDSTAPKFKFTRPVATVNQGNANVKSNKGQLYCKSSMGPEEF